MTDHSSTKAGTATLDPLNTSPKQGNGSTCNDSLCLNLGPLKIIAVNKLRKIYALFSYLGFRNTACTQMTEHTKYQCLRVGKKYLLTLMGFKLQSSVSD